MNLHVGPILRALARRKAWAVLLALQVAVGVALVVQTLAVVAWWLAARDDHAGLPLDDVLLVYADDEGDRDAAATRALVARDLAALRALRDVRAAGFVRSLPLPTLGEILVVRPVDGPAAGVRTTLWTMAGDAWGPVGLGARYIEGDPDAADAAARDPGAPAPLVLSAPAARLLYGSAPVLGREVDVLERGRFRVAGVVDGLVAHETHVPLHDAVDWPVAPPGEAMRLAYAVHCAAGRRPPVTAAALAALRVARPDRHVETEPLAAVHKRFTGSASAIAAVYGTIIVVAGLVVLLGTLAMASFLVNERRQQIGIRRALGARRRDVVAHFLVENALVTGGGVLLGFALAVAIGAYTLSLQSDLLPRSWMLATAAALFLLAGQTGALVPALRASRIPPVTATKAA